MKYLHILLPAHEVFIPEEDEEQIAQFLDDATDDVCDFIIDAQDALETNVVESDTKPETRESRLKRLARFARRNPSLEAVEELICAVLGEEYECANEDEQED